MQFRNRDGDPIDPVPYLVIVLLAFVVGYAWGPIYFQALGFSLTVSLAIISVAFLVLVVVGYHSAIWTADPDYRENVPAPIRMRRFLYAVMIGIVLLVLLGLPFVT